MNTLVSLMIGVFLISTSAHAAFTKVTPSGDVLFGTAVDGQLLNTQQVTLKNSGSVTDSLGSGDNGISFSNMSGDKQRFSIVLNRCMNVAPNRTCKVVYGVNLHGAPSSVAPSSSLIASQFSSASLSFTLSANNQISVSPPAPVVSFSLANNATFQDHGLVEYQRDSLSSIDITNTGTVIATPAIVTTGDVRIITNRCINMKPNAICSVFYRIVNKSSNRYNNAQGTLSITNGSTPQSTTIVTRFRAKPSSPIKISESLAGTTPNPLSLKDKIYVYLTQVGTGLSSFFGIDLMGQMERLPNDLQIVQSSKELSEMHDSYDNIKSTQMGSTNFLISSNYPYKIYKYENNKITLSAEVSSDISSLVHNGTVVWNNKLYMQGYSSTEGDYSLIEYNPATNSVQVISNTKSGVSAGVGYVSSVSDGVLFYRLNTISNEVELVKYTGSSLVVVDSFINAYYVPMVKEGNAVYYAAPIGYQDADGFTVRMKKITSSGITQSVSFKSLGIYQFTKFDNKLVIPFGRTASGTAAIMLFDDSLNLTQVDTGVIFNQVTSQLVSTEDGWFLSYNSSPNMYVGMMYRNGQGGYTFDNASVYIDEVSFSAANTEIKYLNNEVLVKTLRYSPYQYEFSRLSYWYGFSPPTLTVPTSNVDPTHYATGSSFVEDGTGYLYYEMYDAVTGHFELMKWRP